MTGPIGGSLADRPIAVTIVGGYLGAGKTTLVNRLLAAGEPGLAVMVNDFGEINVDAALIESHDGRTITLTNGCICCSMVDGFASALADLVLFEPRPARLVIEASGVADPASIAAYCHRRGIVLDLVLVVAAADSLPDNLSDRYVGETVARQLRSADVVALNKVDLVDANGLAEATALIRSSSQAAIVEVCDGAVSRDVVFGSTRSTRHESASEREASSSDLAQFESWSFATDSPLDEHRFRRFVEQLPRSIVRAKGLVRFESDRPGLVFQRVGARWSLEESSGDTRGSDGTEIVLVGLPGAITDEQIAAALL